MVTLNHFNQLAYADAERLIASCVAIPSWTSALIQGRPWQHLSALMSSAQENMQGWNEADLEQALGAHPRIGDKPTGEQAHAALSRQEQSRVNSDDVQLAQALKEGNARYETRFGRVFLIRAKGRSGEEILQQLNLRLGNSDAQEVEAALIQLREITLLRLAGVIHE
ncbi:2-oxo-4-hydroxy-4-carboxy-5-ureidoimidazoline decarboxylase [Klebsiella sp. BIGb0407]|uniref:2-oxo-4-hydroxy-4-carboxy-5-ureidoimidazoline decarboxylase n=1 Tax=Klebsiella sp. BIGb0407 TaxID=2940603 RepID=UPI00216905B4|nr:2-oxo-4-hydroxy-4-carboxy-5-ureidoimidazoline decarboxylase [Klebsiella sp. BIGb0407]MCS3429844.1 2-oxo-4-hydroxy-4-carboxy-5-ureidoimidazoline decarboxylase [Klebsiella sp. BIGb0407]